MKVIDLLNKIANGEIPKKIKVDNKFIYIHDGIDYKNHDGTYLFDAYIETTTEDMNIEIEIVEDTTEKENKTPDKLDKRDFLDNETLEQVDADLDFIIDKINEIIDYLKSKGDE